LKKKKKKLFPAALSVPFFFIPPATIMASLEGKDTAAADGDPLDPYSRAFDPLAALESADPIPFMRAHPSARPMDNLARIARLMAPELIGTDWRVTGYGGEREGGAMQCMSAIPFFFCFVLFFSACARLECFYITTQNIFWIFPHTPFRSKPPGRPAAAAAAAAQAPMRPGGERPDTAKADGLVRLWCLNDAVMMPNKPTNPLQKKKKT
jgi:hypothetical protein